MSCTNPTKNELCFEKYYMNKKGEYIFVIDNRFLTLDNCDEKYLNFFSSEDSIIFSYTNEVYYKQILYCCDKKFDTIKIANSIGERPRRRKTVGCLYNLMINNKNWQVALYHPLDSIKGIYSFDITDSEQRIFNGILNSFLMNAEKKYYPVIDTVKFSRNPAPALYVNILSENCKQEYFGATVNYIYDSITLFNMLNQITITIIENHFTSHKNNKISDTIGFLDIRDRFDYYVRKYKYTGEIIKDYDSMKPPLPPKSLLK
jgi:hypothetical protein